MEGLPFIERTPSSILPQKNYFAHPDDWPGVYWLSEPEGGALPNAGENMAGTGSWYDSYGGAVCSGRQAPYGFWCSADNPRTNLPGDYQAPYWMPGGFTYPGGAYPDAVGRVSNWSKPRGAVYHIMAAFESIQCLVSNVTNTTVHFDPTVGCDQSAVNPFGWAYAHGWYADNIKEECDSPGEYFFDAEEKALYYSFNSTDGPTGREEFSLVTTKVIFNVSGTQTDPVKEVTLRGLTIRDAALTYLGTTAADVHYLPSDSDWAIQRSGAVIIEGTSLSHRHFGQLKEPRWWNLGHP